MKSYYLFGSRILTHVLFWVSYFLLFGFIWANENNYFQSYFLEFILLPIRIGAVYITIYVLLPKNLLPKKYISFGWQYLLLLLISGVLQRVFIYFFYETILQLPHSPLFDLNGILRAIILVNSTVIFVGAAKILELFHQERELNQNLKKPDQIIDIKADKRIFRISTDEIQYLEGLGNYVTYQLTGDQKLIAYTSLKEALKNLPAHFLRIHKSYIINKNHIRSYNNENVEIAGKLLPIGKAVQIEFED
ncbi:LytR/AlgR family response regulator transcription factor [Flexithrix dorotheae]|uniref:LytR/AlgR family response regulator transcription factor n=1 Tax=Flexithrix dorotheae TaxID=70993 RepID=UPI00037A10AD|nr:LytTR family DNA-binding domain-containing protein [Flexithrix dorotheae]